MVASLSHQKQVSDIHAQTPLRSYRYERKFLFDELDWRSAHALIRAHPAMFYEPYPPRYVNNFYLDTHDMQFYYDNIIGNSQRIKVRVRWYASLFGFIHRPVLELKIKNGLVGTKRQYSLNDFTLSWSFQLETLRQVFAGSDLPDDVRLLLRNLDIVLLNRYSRRYFASRDGRFRITLDTGLEFYRIDPLRNHFCHHQVDHRSTIVELKYAVDHDVAADRVAGYFPFRVTKSSKYVQGIERVYF